MTNSMHKTIGDVIVENRNECKNKAQKRIDEIEDILLEMPFTNPEFEKLVNERNNLLIKIQK